MPASRPPMTPAWVAVLLALLIGIQPTATDMYLPALPALSHHMGANLAQAQLTLSGLFLTFGISQLFWGPLSDRWGRRPVLLVGLGLYTLCAIGAVFASSMSSLTLLRMAQGVGMGAAVVCGRALIRDLYTADMGTRVMSKGQTGLGILACLSAPLGGLLSDLWGAQAALAMVAITGACIWVTIALTFRETLQHRVPSIHTRALLHSAAEVLSHRTFWAYALLSTTTFCGLYLFLSTSSFIYIDHYGLPQTLYGAVMLVTSLSFITGTFLTRRLMNHWSIPVVVRAASSLAFLAGATLVVLHLLELDSLFYTLIPICIFFVSHGINQSCGQAGCVTPFPKFAGMAAALNGFLMMVCGFVVGAWMGSVQAPPHVILAWGLGVLGVLIALIAWGPVRKHGATA